MLLLMWGAEERAKRIDRIWPETEAHKSDCGHSTCKSLQVDEALINSTALDTSILGRRIAPDTLAGLCGVAPAMSYDAFPDEIPLASDRFGNQYVQSQLMRPATAGRFLASTGFSGCDCSDVDISLNLFNLWFEDCLFATDAGFADLQEGEDRRKALCAAFQYLESLIAPNESVCEERLKPVNIRVQPSVAVSAYYGGSLDGFALGSRVLGYASPYVANLPSNPGIVFGLPQTIINSGEYPAGNGEEFMHAFLRINFNLEMQADYETGLPAYDPQANNITYDLYSVGLHEAMHLLGFFSSFTAANNFNLGSTSGNPGVYYPFDQFLLLDRNGGQPLILNDPPALGSGFPRSPVWRFNDADIDPGQDMYLSCQGGTQELNMLFEGLGGSYPVYTGDSFDAGRSFSHLEQDCLPGGPQSYVMVRSLPANDHRRVLHPHEADIMNRIGYCFGVPGPCQAVGAAPDGLGLGCTTFDFTTDFCPPDPAVFTIPLDVLTGNDPNGENLEIAYITTVGGTGELLPGGTHYQFSTTSQGEANLVYALIGEDGTLGNATLVRLRADIVPDASCFFHCPDFVPCTEPPFSVYNDCEELWGPDYDCGDIDSKNPCNLICNPEMCGTVALLNINGSQSNFYRIPGWTRTHGSLHYRKFIADPISGTTLVNPNLGLINGRTGAMTFAVMEEGQRYMLKWSNRLRLTDVPGIPELTIDLIKGEELSPVASGQPINYTGPIRSVQSPTVQPRGKTYGTYFCTDEGWEGFTALWFRAVSNTTYLDNVELLTDDFSAGEDQSVAFCNQPVQLGGKHCMLSDVGVLYEWFRLDNNGQVDGDPIASYRVLNTAATDLQGNIDPATLQLTVAPAQTTTYRLRRSIYELGGLPEDFSFCKTEPDGTITSDCLYEDDVTVFVSVPLPNPDFTYSSAGCLFDFFSEEQASGLRHRWVFGSTGLTSMAQNPSGVLLMAGTHEVEHTIISVCGTVTATQLITVDPPDAAFTYSEQDCLFDFFSFDPDPSLQHDWAFGTTGLASTAPNPSGINLPNGVHQVSHTVSNSCGSAEAVLEVLVENCCAPLSPGLSATEDCGTATFAFSDLPPGEVPVIDYGDGTQGTALVHLYAASGMYTATATVSDGCDGEVSLSVEVEALACFTCDDCPGNTIGTPGQATLLSSLITAGTVPPSGTPFQACVEGVLVIDQSYNLQNSLLFMQPGARVEVPDQVTLGLLGSSLMGCDAMWRGIELMRGSQLKMGSSVIADAQYALYAHPTFQVGQPFSGISVGNSLFDNNFVGFYVPATGAARLNAAVSGNTFSQSATALKPPFTGQVSGPENLPNQSANALAGIMVNDLSSFNSFDNGFSKKLALGIISFNSNLSVSKNNFDSMNEDAYPSFGPSGAGVWAASSGSIATVDGSTFTNSANGIVSDGCRLLAASNTFSTIDWGITAGLGLPGRIEIKQNGFDDIGQVGIFANHSHTAGELLIRDNIVQTDSDNGGAGIFVLFTRADMDLRDNQVTVSKQGSGISLFSYSGEGQLVENTVGLEDSQLASAGIGLTGASNCLLYANTITGQGLSGQGNIALDIASSSGNVYCCNSFDNTRIGAHVTGSSLATDNFRGNTFGNHTTSLLLPDANAVLGTQTHTENIWAGTGTAVYGVPLSIAELYPFIIDPSIPGAEPSSHSPQGWFEDESSETQGDVCTVAACEVDGFGPEKEDVKRLVQGDTSLSEGVLWGLHRYLYAKLQGESVKDQGVKAFLALPASHPLPSHPLPSLYGIEAGMDSLLRSGEGLGLALGTNREAVLQAFQGLVGLDELLPSASPSQQALLMEARADIVKALQVLSYAQEELVVQWLSSIASGLSVLSAANNDLSLSSTPQLNDKAVNAVALAHLGQSLSGMSTAEEIVLGAIAKQCPYTGGPAVYTARAMLAVATGQLPDYDDGLACAPVQHFLAPPNGPEAGAAHDLRTLRLFPNPAKDELSIVWRGAAEQQGQVIAYDAYGRQVKGMAIMPGAAEAVMKIGGLPNGLYIIRVRLDGEDTAHRIIVQH